MNIEKVIEGTSWKNFDANNMIQSLQKLTSEPPKLHETLVGIQKPIFRIASSLRYTSFKSSSIQTCTKSSGLERFQRATVSAATRWYSAKKKMDVFGHYLSINH